MSFILHQYSWDYRHYMNMSVGIKYLVLNVLILLNCFYSCEVD